MIEINFKRSAFNTSISLFVGAILICSYLIYKEYNIPERIALSLFLIATVFVLIFRLKQLHKLYSSGNNVALKIDEFGIENNTQAKSYFISWSEISAFEIGHFRTRQIYIKPINPNHFPRKKYFGFYFTSKPELLWIDSDMIDIKRDELINILNRELHNYNNNNNSVNTNQS
ncbi:STM3941 family protein [Epilithonimonas lactis]|uniref:Uncharacterized protein n=1 Tax=Epilithonimonas lactis TaxID=421072 RepID=A0A085B8W2_9FLAO|nr:STM3941 family protein [Epilithonimonas lactis]KFC18907.1 hypothetical protein IO89_15345 [Epilithonimonas lactis]SEQ98375.1 hypothetical protein SAMN04488097_3621 [Epilithonimonas lactis]